MITLPVWVGTGPQSAVTVLLMMSDQNEYEEESWSKYHGDI